MSVEQSFGFLTQEFQNGIFPQALQYVIFVSPILLAGILITIFSGLWLRYVRSKFYLSLKYATLEIKLPKDTFKSPLAMETFLHALHNTSDGSVYAQYWKGEYRPYYSLELVSIEGRVKFYVWCEDRRKGGVMSALYSQFPGIEIIDHEDYTKHVHYDGQTMKMWGTEFALIKDDAYPIKTYVDYGLDRDPKEELKVDPLVPVLEFLGSVGPNQQIWYQFVIRAHKKEQRKPGHWWKKTDAWKDGAQKIIDEMIGRDPKSRKYKDKEGKDTAIGPVLSKGEQETIAAIERSLTKVAFDVGIRTIYLAKKDMFNTPFGIGGVVGGFKQFSSESLNGFKPNSEKGLAQLSGYPWEDFKDRRRNMISTAFLRAYKYRGFFFEPHKSKTMVLNTEELATLYHFPGSVAATPGLDRVPSKKAEAPANLPI